MATVLRGAAKQPCLTLLWAFTRVECLLTCLERVQGERVHAESSHRPPARHQVAEAVRLAREARPDLPLEGPIQYDAAVDPVVAKQKVKGESAVAGRANVCIFPDLNTGNNTYKVIEPAAERCEHHCDFRVVHLLHQVRCSLFSVLATERCEHHA